VPKRNVPKHEESSNHLSRWWRTAAAWLQRFVRERTPGWEGTNNAPPLSTREKGFRGEKVAQWYLKKHHYHIVETNWWAPGRRGELDIIAYKDNTLIAVEVKSYPTGELTPKEALHFDKGKKVARLLEQYVKAKRRFDCALRVDLLLVEWAEAGKVDTIKHIKSAVTGSRM